MIAIFVGLIGCVLLALLVINMNFLEPYYISNKKTGFEHVWQPTKCHGKRHDRAAG